MAVVPDTRNSIVIIKNGPYRGGTRTWSNRYHFEGDLPADDAAWTTLADNIVAAEKLCLNASTEIIQATGYDSSTATTTNPHGDAVFSKLYTTAGTYAPTGGAVPSPGDAAILVRYQTPARSTKNHPVYLFNYYHSCYQSGGSSDNVAADQKALFQTYANDWVTGFSDGSTNRERCGPHGAVSTSARVDPFVRHRDFPN